MPAPLTTEASSTLMVKDATGNSSGDRCFSAIVTSVCMSIRC